MAFKAATDGECVKCKQPIHKGDPITWKRTGPLAGRYHFTCPGDVPPAVSIVMEPAKPTVEPTAEPAEPACDDFTAEPECELAPIVEPGSRAWLRTASRSEREDYMLSVLRASEAPITRRDWAKLTARMMARLSDKQARKLSRWARGVWAGVTLHAWPADDDDYRQMALDFAEPVEQAHGELVMGWRSLVAAWNEGV